MSEEKNIHIGLIVPEGFTDEIVDKFKADLDTESLNIDIRKIPFGGLYNSMEWAIPTAIGVFILKSYFDSFLKEAGKDHYNILKKWLKKTADGSRAIKITKIVATKSTDKIESENTQSQGFSIQVKAIDGHQIKFLFDIELTTEEWNNAIDSALNLIEQHFNDGIADNLTLEIKNLDKIIYGVINKKTKIWEFFDYKKIYLQKLKNAQ